MNDDRISEARWRELIGKLGGVGQFEEIVSEVANALASAVLLAAHVRRTTGEQVLDAERLEAAVDKAARVLSRLRPENRR